MSDDAWLWAIFAAGALGDELVDADGAAKVADKMLEIHRKRFPRRADGE